MAWIEARRNGWVVRWHPEDSKDKTKSKYFADHAEAEEERDLLNRWGPTRRPFTAQQAADALASSFGRSRSSRSPRLGEYARSLIENDPELSVGTKEGYDATLRNHVDGTRFGMRRLKDITPQDVREYWASVKPKKVYVANGKGATGNVYRLLAKVFNQAVMDGIIDASPLSRARIKRPSRRRATEVVPLTVNQIEILASATNSERDRLCILVGGYVGLRAGEVGGLRVRDLDAARSRLSVNQAVTRTRGKKSVGPPKTHESRRVANDPASPS